MLLFMDSFDHYTTVLEKWTAFAGASAGATDTSGIGPYGRRSSQGMRLRLGSTAIERSHNVMLFAGARGPTCVVGFAFQSVSPFTGLHNDVGLESLSAKVFSIRALNQLQLYFRLLNTGELQIVLGGTNTVLGVTPALTQGVFTHIEVKIVLAQTNGLIVVRFDGTTVWSYIGDTQAIAMFWDQIEFGPICGTSGPTPLEWWIDDVYLLDALGDPPWIDLLGDCRIDVSDVTAEGASSQWDPFSGTNNAVMVNEFLFDGDDTYVSSVTPGDIDTYIVEDAPLGPIRGVQLVFSMKKEEDGVCEMRGVVRHAGENYPSSVLAPGPTYRHHRWCLQANPGTGAAWVRADFNAAEFGYQR